MEHYYLNNAAQSTGEREVHQKICRYFPQDHTYLGYFSNCGEAIKKARTIAANVDGCYWCSRECHTR